MLVRIPFDQDEAQTIGELLAKLHDEQSWYSDIGDWKQVGIRSCAIRLLGVIPLANTI